ncbi:relaxase/mobilization nuclease domain-containing protein [Clostridium algidicarnis]|uniref:relaxase/mobilization nuclease domain-containing protein n=1 Tax=Clostridium algidicarnis TaxID=37659 RepID=UPI001C0DF25B|nr:relaxase/mobilization nuclease domain-containing protein [Clostridium algidicarnis]MBU3209868.1 relaxase/mobilization nuclease domain-containing protein [Clostridium algidicarnis]
MVLKDEYEYMMTTHVDKKHIHNHFVFNNVNNKTGKAYLSNKRKHISFKVKEIEELKEKHLAIRDYKKYRNVYKKYQNAKDKRQYYRAFVSEILLYEGPKKKLGKPITKELIDSIGDIENEIKSLSKQKTILVDERKTIKIVIKDLSLIQSNINNYMKRNRENINQGIEI